MITHPTTLTSVATRVFATAVVTALMTKLVALVIVPTLNIPTGLAPVAPIDCLQMKIKELVVTAVVDTVAVPPTSVTEPKELAPAVVVVPTLELMILFPAVPNVRLPLVRVKAALAVTAPVSAMPPLPAWIVVADVVLVEPIVKAFAPAPVPIAIVLPPVEFPIFMVWAPVPPKTVAVPVCAPVPPILNVPLVVEGPKV